MDIPNSFADKSGTIQLSLLDENFTTVEDNFNTLDGTVTSIDSKFTNSREDFTVGGTVSATTVSATSFSGDGSSLTGIVSIPTGVIVMWSGTVATIPSGWYLCDGSNGTPDLRNKFIVGAYSDTSGTAYSTITGANTQSGGSKDSIIPSHNHSATSTVSESSHRHWISSMATDDRNISGTGSNGQEYGLVADAGSYSADDPNKSTGRYSAYATTGLSVSTSVGTTGSSTTNANLPPYFALAYIMKA